MREMEGEIVCKSDGRKEKEEEGRRKRKREGERGRGRCKGG
jgi:hypothetical protein